MFAGELRGASPAADTVQYPILVVPSVSGLGRMVAATRAVTEPRSLSLLQRRKDLVATHLFASALHRIRSAADDLPSAPSQLTRLRPRGGDLAASVTGAISAVPDGMAASVIVGVAPIHGLYASIAGPIIGGAAARSPLLVVSTTSAAALSASELVEDKNPNEVLPLLFLLTMLAGIFLLLASLAGLAKLTQFISHSVMTGFLMGIATLVILGQLGTLLGYSPEGSNAITRTIDLARHVSEVDVTTTGISALTIACLVLLAKTPVRSLSSVFALAGATAIVAIAGISGVELVSDVGEIPSGLPTPSIPDLDALDLSLLTGAMSLAVIVFVQTAGVSQGLPSAGAGGAHNRDIAASGLANVGAALFQGQPVGGSLGQTALNVRAGARTRLAAILSGVWIIVIVLVLGGVVEQVPMPSLAALLVVAAVGTFNLRESQSIWQSGWESRATIGLTFLATLFLPVQFAVAAGILLSAGLYLSSAAADVRVVELVRQEDGGLAEQKAPRKLTSDSVTILQVYGSLFFAGARTLARRLPEPGDAERPAVLLRLRGHTRAGATLMDVLSRYARDIEARDGQLFMAGLSPELVQQFASSRKLNLAPDELFAAQALQGESVRESYEAATAWLIRHQPDATE